MTAGPRPSSTSNSTARRRTRSSASRTGRRCFSKGFSDGAGQLVAKAAFCHDARNRCAWGATAMRGIRTLAACGLLFSALSPATAGEKLRASDKAALAECLKYVGDFPGDVPGVNDTPTPAIHIDNAIKLAGHEPASCVNYVTELCSFESDDGRSQLGLIDCANREVAVWEDRLNATYAALMAKAAPKARDGYRKMQRAWIAYRDARCKAEASAETVNIDRQSNITVSCVLDATARQALILDNELSDLQ
ncbi:DUF1311 domain-containing protein [Mesorhizobium sp. M2D.F.Ca.ET.185.01.1.1]|nr:DUF1311 domain-containing protein [Mesorhizobium sp. M2D.F.Ca.ET.140.01.1.1]TGP17280.1 DUF1311 domain-containing protein [Mesorhizobium sp. M2D.F.Ca.ET.233.01.1.1]TGP33155.1 DUF1311 domain-containing protein [Mesorhizobium sp. M2D.F.Ca.ET.232.01.1.1]TGP52667.1 DUF1311 domain-containing protein [bacterium M00.F.Ca.ET.230.01.1.1]TGP59564.1 DUF1311 domain-containing protein [Mesorhizobium sp. M2D.F.Ca.ET.226.01.1.1]TGP69200.1 DUF1311 domain-containing protein [Mesorhizobium sp. M2D.F.Ca.ET.225